MGMPFTQRRQDAATGVRHPECDLLSLAKRTDLNYASIWTLCVVEHVVRDLVDGPLESGYYIALKCHLSHHDIHACIDELLLFVWCLKSIRRYMTVVVKIKLLIARRFKEVRPVGIVKESLEIVGF